MSKKKIRYVVIYLISVIILAISFIIGIFNVFNHYNTLNISDGYDSSVGLNATFEESKKDEILDAYIEKYYSDSDENGQAQVKVDIMAKYYLFDGVYYYEEVPQINYYLVITCGILSGISLMTFVMFLILSKRCE